MLKTLSLILLLAPFASTQTLPAKWEELTAEDFVTALNRAGGVCVLPFGIIEKHGPSGPLGTDLINIRATVVKATEQEYAVIFPEYYFGQIFEATHQPGTLAYSTRLQEQMMQETVAEMARNGCKKIVLANGHGGNTAFVNYFLQTQLETPRDYVVYSYSGIGNAPDVPAAARPSKPGADGHAGEGEVAMVMGTRPELGHPDRGGRESGANLRRLDLPQGVATGINWYSMYPNHYAGDASGATGARGQAMLEAAAVRLAAALRAIKADQTSPRLQKEFFGLQSHPLDTKQ
jgi:creatinine amidohydrolase